MQTNVYIDIHAHLLPGLDDGPADWAGSVELCRKLVDDGIGKVIATPHQLGRYGNQGQNSQIRQLTHTLNDLLKTHQLPLTVYAGAEVRLDERIESLLASDQILTLADGGRYLLLELMEVAVDVCPLLANLCSAGIIPIIAHIERYPYFIQNPQDAILLAEAGAVFQVTASSLTGRFGQTVQQAAWWLMQSGTVAVVATDVHPIAGRGPQMHAAFDQLSRRWSVEAAHLLCRQNPQHILQGQPLIVPPQRDAQNLTRRT